MGRVGVILIVVGILVVDVPTAVFVGRLTGNILLAVVIGVIGPFSLLICGVALRPGRPGATRSRNRR
ncbi:hypothetical protein ACIPVB_11825 [Microbacterium sp. NPDC090007]|uniref:hypothetical protein n=1 Tax=Microbacterium sp. NPDC090007 TaxID=3364204 RepID=UPI0037F86930